MERVNRISVYVDRTGGTLTVWFGNPHDEYVCEETGEEVVLMKDRHGNVIGLRNCSSQFPLQSVCNFRLRNFPPKNGFLNYDALLAEGW